MPTFKVALLEHGYASIDYERNIISAAGGELIDAEGMELSEALRLCESVEAIMVRRIPITAEIIRRLKRCKIILRYGVGTDNVDVEAATRAKIIVGHVPVYCVDEVSTHAIALLLGCVRKLISTHAKMTQGGWDVHRDDPIFRMAGKTLGIVGFGNIGRAVAQKLTGWGLRMIAFDPYFEKSRTDALRVQFVEFETLLRESDYISLHCPLLPETRHLMDEEAFALTKPSAILVNTARGAVVDGEALLAALKQKQIAAAAIDVFEEEPLPKKSPLRNHPQILASDHTAWYSEESQIELQTIAAEEVAGVCTGGLPRSLANPEVLRRLDRWDEWTPPENVLWQLRRAQHPWRRK